MRSICIAIICIIIMGSLMGCKKIDMKDSKSVSNESTRSKVQSVVLKDGDKEIKITKIGKDIRHPIDKFAIIGTITYSTDKKFLYIVGKTGEEEKLYILDLQDEQLFEAEKNTILVESKRKYWVEDIKNGLVKIHDSITNELIKTINLSKDELFDSESDIQVEASNTDKYLLLRQSYSVKCIIDIASGKLLELPFKEAYFHGWTPNDERAILEVSNKTYIWELGTKKVKEIGADLTQELNWSQNGKYVYYFDRGEVGDRTGDIMMGHNESKNTWERIYSTTKPMNYYKMKWINEDEFIYLTDNEKTGLPTFNFGPNHHAVKVNINTKKEKDVALGVGAIDDYAWSYDNNYLYYVSNGLNKTYIGFGENK